MFKISRDKYNCIYAAPILNSPFFLIWNQQQVPLFSKDEDIFEPRGRRYSYSHKVGYHIRLANSSALCHLKIITGVRYLTSFGQVQQDRRGYLYVERVERYMHILTFVGIVLLTFFFKYRHRCS
jgi:hypothetical protein